jgi:hypothetical protein
MHCQPRSGKPRRCGVWKWKWPKILASDPTRTPDRSLLYLDVVALGNLSAAIRAAAAVQGLTIPLEAFRLTGRDTVRPDPLYGVTVHSRIPGRDGLRVTATWRQRGWLLEGGHADHRIEGTAPELAEVARVAHAWHDGTALADIPQLAPCVTVQAVDYRHLGVMRNFGEPGMPTRVLRVWTDSSGSDREETFTGSLTWEESHLTSPMARPTYHPDPVEIDMATVDWFIQSVTEHINAELRQK